MNTHRKRSLLTWLLIATVSFLLAAQKHTSIPVNDSVNATILNEYKTKLTAIEKQRITDSVKQSQLELQLSSVRSADSTKKEALQKQLLALQEKESLRLAFKKAQIDSLRSTVKGYPVIGFFNDTLFTLYSRLGSFSAKDRAIAVSERIHTLAGNYKYKADSLKICPSESTTDLTFGDNIIVSVSENDALWNGTNQDALTQKYKEIIVTSISKYKAETSWTILSKQIGFAILILIIAFVLIYYIGKGSKWMAKGILQQENKRIKGINIKDYTLFDTKQQIRVLLNVNAVVKWLMILVVVYVALPILFSIFPWTKNFASILLGYIFNPVKAIALALWDYLPKLITILVILFVFRYIIKGLHFLKNEVEKDRLHLPGFYPDWANPTYQLIKVLILAFMFVVIFPYLPGSDSPIFKGVSVFLGFLITFGSSGSLSNIISGFVITYMRLFKIGDRVKIGEVVGDVIEKSLLVTRVRTIKNEIISIPNSTVMSSHTINYSSEAPAKGLILHTTVTIGYDVPWKDMHQALIDAALRTEFILHEPLPFVLQTSLDDFYVSYQINGYTKEPNQQVVIYSHLHQNIQDVCNERGIEILSPHYRYERDGNVTSIPEKYWPKDYKPPTFKVSIKKEDPK
jgi:small-conductance mechanosensitive channel